MNIVDLLCRDHRKVQDLMGSLSAALRNDEFARKTLLHHLMDEIHLHSHIEETIFYPSIERYEAMKDFVVHGIEEHRFVERLLVELDEMDTHLDEWMDKLNMLSDTLMAHIKQEEQIIFPKVRNLLPASVLMEMAARMSALKEFVEA